MSKRQWAICIALAVASCGSPIPQPQDPMDAKSPAPADWTLPASGTLSLADLSNFAKQKRDFVKADDFSKAFDDSPLNGRTFAVEIDAPNYGGSSVTMIHWEYSAEKGVLTVNIDPSSSIQSKTDIGPKKKMSNAFGAEIEADTMETWQIALRADYDKPLGVFPKSDSLYDFGVSHGFLSHEMRLPPEQARKLTEALRLRLEGKVVANSTGQTVHCGTETRPATVSSPTESTTHECTINVRYARVSIVTKDGRTLHEWLDKPDKVAAKDEPEPAVSPDNGDGEVMHDGYPEDGALVDAEGNPIEPESEQPVQDEGADR